MTLIEARLGVSKDEKECGQFGPEGGVLPRIADEENSRISSISDQKSRSMVAGICTNPTDNLSTPTLFQITTIRVSGYFNAGS